MPENDAEIFQHYRVLRRDDGSLWKLGAGAMGVTYKAIDTNLDAPVALKVINALYTGHAAARERFGREARAAASLRHRNVASVYHLGQDGDTFFYAMEFIDGETVEHFVRREGAQPWQVALSIALQVSRALMAAHEKNLVHRDIKPANIMLVRETGEDDLVVKLIDFGLAKTLVEEGGDTANISGSGFLGTPLYASPEQCEELAPDIRSDIYSLGVTLWFVLAGRPPFGGSLGQVFSQHLHAPLPWDQLPAAVPAPVRALLDRMLAKDRADRPQTPADLRREIEESLRDCDGSVPAGTRFTLESRLRQTGGRLPAPLVAELLRPLAQIADASHPVPPNLTPSGVRIAVGNAPDGDPARTVPFTDAGLTGGESGWLSIQPLGETAEGARTEPGGVTLLSAAPGYGSLPAALAALAYELLGGLPPAQDRPCTPLAQCDEDANVLLRRALAGDFDDLPALEFADTLAGRLRSRGVASVSAVVPVAPSGGASGKPAWKGWTAASALVLLAVGGVALWLGHRRPPPASVPDFQTLATPLPETPAPSPSAAPARNTTASVIDRARVLRKRGDNPIALARLHEAQAVDPDNPLIMYELALTYEAMNRTERALKQWRHLYQLGPSIGLLYSQADARLHAGPAASPAGTAQGSQSTP